MSILIIKLNQTEDTKTNNSNHNFSNNHTQHTLILTYKRQKNRTIHRKNKYRNR